MAEVKVDIELPSISSTPSNTNGDGIALTLSSVGGDQSSIVPPPLLPSPLSSQSYANNDDHNDAEHERVCIISTI